jgi:hypothetical protein
MSDFYTVGMAVLPVAGMTIDAMTIAAVETKKNNPDVRVVLIFNDTPVEVVVDETATHLYERWWKKRVRSLVW